MHTAVKLTQERFAEGMTLAEYVEQMTKNKETFKENHDTFSLKPDDMAFFRELDGKRRVLILAEDWCGDVVRYLPAFARVAEAARSWEVRVFCRDENHDLADQWLKEGKYRAIPVIVFFDEDWREIACFVEKPAAVYHADSAVRETFARENPKLPDAYASTAEMSEATLAQYIEFVRRFRAEHGRQWQHLFVEEIKKKLQM